MMSYFCLPTHPQDGIFRKDSKWDHSEGKSAGKKPLFLFLKYICWPANTIFLKGEKYFFTASVFENNRVAF